MWKEFSEEEAVKILEKYNISILTAQRRHLLGNALLNLENKNIKMEMAKMQLRNQILFNKEILNALEEASFSDFNNSISQLKELKTKLEYTTNL